MINWLSPYNYAFSLSFIIMGLIIPITGIPSSAAFILRLMLIFLGIYVLIGTFRRGKLTSVS